LKKLSFRLQTMTFYALLASTAFGFGNFGQCMERNNCLTECEKTASRYSCLKNTCPMSLCARSTVDEMAAHGETDMESGMLGAVFHERKHVPSRHKQMRAPTEPCGEMRITTYMDSDCQDIAPKDPYILNTYNSPSACVDMYVGIASTTCEVTTDVNGESHYTINWYHGLHCAQSWMTIQGENGKCESHGSWHYKIEVLPTSRGLRGSRSTESDLEERLEKLKQQLEDVNEEFESLKGDNSSAASNKRYLLSELKYSLEYDIEDLEAEIEWEKMDKEICTDDNGTLVWCN